MENQFNALLLNLLLLGCKQCVYGRIELVAALEEVEFKNEEISHNFSAEFLYERAGCCRRTT